jgi:iron complex outermembrane receptor protein
MNTLGRILTVAASAALLLPVPAIAQQDSAGSVEEVVVTARKRDESLQDVPIAITAFTESTIQAAGIERPADFIRLMPNVTIVDTANVGDTQVSIRGIVSTRDAESTFAYVVDGVLSTNPNSFNEELVDVQQIEVLKGPQGALYGRNAVAGAILVTTKEPTEELSGMLRVGAGNVGQQRLAGRVSGGNSVVRGSLSGSYRQTDGFFTNTFTGQSDVVDYLEDTTVRGRVIVTPNDNLKLDFRGGVSDVSGGAINFNAAFGIPAFEAAFGSPAFFQDVNTSPIRFAFNVPGENKQETSDFAIKADWTWGDIGFTALASYNKLEEYLLSDGTSATFYGYELNSACINDRATLNNLPVDQGGAGRDDLFGPFASPFVVLPSFAAGDPPAPGPTDFAGVYGPYTPTSCDGYQYQERNQEDMSVELRLTSPQDQALRWIAGIYATQIERDVVVGYGADTGQGFLRQPYVSPTGPNPTDLLFDDTFDTDVIALFGEIAYDVTDTFELALAVRWDQEDRKVANNVPPVASSGLNCNFRFPGIPTNCFDGAIQPINPAYNANFDPIPDRSATFEQFQPKLTARWSATDNLTAYASYGVGFRSGGFNNIGSSALLNFWFNTGSGGPGELVDAQLVINDEYDKEVSNAVEVGIKSNWFDNRLQLNAAVFRTDVEDNQFFEFFAGPFGILRVVTTIDDMYIQGFEADFNWLVTDYLSVYGGIGLLDSEIEANTNRPLSVGNEVPQAPGETGNLGAQLNLPLGGSLEFFARADYQYIGETWFHTLQGEATPTIWQVFFGPGITQDFSKAKRDAYGTLDLRAGISGDRWSLVAWARNLTEEEYLEEVIPAPEFGGSFIHPAARRGYGVDFQYNF